MVRSKRTAEVRGARSVIVEDQPSFVEHHGRRGKQYSGGRKTEALEHVGAQTPDTDPDGTTRRTRRRTR
jgi:hypothetical protein